MATGTRLAIGATIVLSVTAYMAYLGASSSWRYYLTVDECLADAAELQSDRIRVSGLISVDSLQVATDRSRADFRMEGSHQDLSVRCLGPLPDNLAEQRQVVVEGNLRPDGVLCGDKVLTRCASKYSSQGPRDASAVAGAR
jgi:cytochrome c-type biogenesis protein CcmE